MLNCATIGRRSRKKTILTARYIRPARPSASVTFAPVVVFHGYNWNSLTVTSSLKYALSPHVSRILSDVPFLCHFRRAVELSTDSPYCEISHYFRVHDPLHATEGQVYGTLSYFDCCNLVERIRGECLLSVGLEDVICPPSTIFAAYNRIRAPKEIRVYPDFGHNGSSRHEDEKVAFLARG